MRNVLEELLEHCKDRVVKCAQVKYNPYYDEDEAQNVYLHIGHTNDDLVSFHRRLLDINYDSGYGSQELYGTIWYTDGTWSDRREYDGSEWWEHQSCPTIPTELQ